MRFGREFAADLLKKIPVLTSVAYASGIKMMIALRKKELDDALREIYETNAASTNTGYNKKYKIEKQGAYDVALLERLAEEALTRFRKDREENGLEVPDVRE